MNNNTQNAACQNCKFRSLIFDGMSQKEMRLIESNRTEKTYLKGELIIKQGQAINEFIYLKEGLIKVYIQRDNNKTQIISIAKPYDFVSFISTFASDTYQYSISALEDSKVCIIKLDTVKELVKSNGKFALDLIGKISQSSDQIIQNSYNIFNKQLKGKIAHMLIEFSEKIYHSMEYELPISRKEFAQLLGVTTENVIRILSEFRKDEIIKVYGKSIVISRPDMLKRISNLG